MTVPKNLFTRLVLLSVFYGCFLQSTSATLRGTTKTRVSPSTSSKTPYVPHNKQKRRLQDELAEELFFSVTYRDFLPSTCYFGLGSEALEAIQLDAWDISLEPSNEDDTCGLLHDIQGWRDNFLDQVVLGHPDFEAHSQLTSGQQCDNPNHVPVGSCVVEDGPTGVVLLDDLENDDAGIPKPVYCLPGDEDRCGFVQSSANNGRSPQTQSQKKFFDLWYSVDDLRYSKRIGQRLAFLLVDAESGEYRFDSDSDNDAPDFGEDTTPNFFAPLNRFKE